MNDYVIFKFRAINKHLLASLINSDIYFAQPSCLNDPFDCRVDVRSAIENAITKSPPEACETLRKLVKGKGFFEKVEADVAKFGVSAFSLELNNPLMWSHYANAHRGVSLLYSFPEAYFHENDDRILGISAVEYDTNPLSDWFVQRASSLGSYKEFGTALFTKILTIKAKPWKYEQEVRILRTTPGLESLDREYLRQVCFGLETTKDDVALVRKIIEQGRYDLTFCKMARCTDTDFGLKAEEL